MAKPVFSGHESFACKSHWLKRGYDFVNEGNNFNADDAVVEKTVKVTPKKRRKMTPKS